MSVSASGAISAAAKLLVSDISRFEYRRIARSVMCYGKRYINFFEIKNILVKCSCCLWEFSRKQVQEKFRSHGRIAP